ncbi:MAG: ABC transporter ATP-binding protein [Bacilli bacterium]|nr:ABC transporter ATP-binding protein [Bacilli bacterium]
MMNNGVKQKNGHTFKRIVKLLFKYHPVMVPILIFCVLFSAGVATVPAILQQKIIAIIEKYQVISDWNGALKQVLPIIIFLIILYVVSIILNVVYTQLLAILSQKFLSRLRIELFSVMQNLPIRYFDTNKHGDIMSRYTNDIDTIRELISNSIPAILRAAAVVLSVFVIMLYYSLYMTVLILAGVALMLIVSKKFGGGSAKYFLAQQKAIGKLEGFIQEMMNGQKVIKVFNHEEKSIDDLEVINEELRMTGFRANACANILGPVIMNIGNILYVIVAVVGGLLITLKVPNISLSQLFHQEFAFFGISFVVPFLNMTRQFTSNVNQLSQQVNVIVRSIAGAKRVFDLMDEEAEVDEGYVTLVNAIIDEEGNITETNNHTGRWAWKHPHGDGTTTYTELKGDVVLTEVDFAYVENKPVLHDISVYARPGQKVAFVGATGAGKTTITNLINRFYDIADGKIRYDGININKIKKADLRKSLGIVLQETNLFTGTVMDNIRYGNLEATDEQCIEAARLAGAHDFIKRLPEKYNTVLYNNGSNLSQGQRQLIAIARAAVADPPVMILDEATSSIDTRTEAIVQRGMDKLMEGRTVFVIAHRLSTVMNSDVIMVLDHGRIIERGTHQELIDKQGTYYQLYTGAFELE